MKYNIDVLFGISYRSHTSEYDMVVINFNFIVGGPFNLFRVSFFILAEFMHQTNVYNSADGMFLPITTSAICCACCTNPTNDIFQV